MSLSLTIPATVQPVTLAEAKRHCRVNPASTAEDDDVALLIKAAVARVELETGRQLLEATYVLTLDYFPCRPWLTVPKPNLLAVDSITYVDANAVLQTWSPTLYQVTAPAGPFADFGRIAPVYGGVWPSVKPGTFDTVVITFRAGYGTTAEAVPADIREAIKLIVASTYRNREDGEDASGRASRMVRGYWKRTP